MTTVMETALKAAGVPMRTLPERVWYYVKDHPNSTCHDLHSVLHIPFDRVATVCGLLVRRKMLLVSKDARLAHGKFGGIRHVNVYSVPSTMSFYNVLPLAPVKKALPAAPKVQPLAPVAAIPAFPTPAPAEQKPKFDLDSLTIREAQLLYEHLHRMFGKPST